MKVVCVQNKKKNKFSITVGNEYKLISTESGKYQIKNDKGHIFSYNKWFFKTDVKIRDEKIEEILK